MIVTVTDFGDRITREANFKQGISTKWSRRARRSLRLHRLRLNRASNEGSCPCTQWLLIRQTRRRWQFTKEL